MKIAPIVPVVAVLGLASAIFIACNMSNETADGGYAAYVFSKPMTGSRNFEKVIIGPGGTGLVWRQDSVNICVTPYTMKEQFSDIRAADQLKMTAEAFLVYRIDKTKIREFVENYGAISETSRNPEDIANDAYVSFIQEPFRTAVRTAIATYKGLEAPGKIPEITKMVEASLRKQLEGSPFIVESITIGSTIPPESVSLGITKKVEATQEYERQATQLEIAKRAEEIANAEGRAKANRVNQEAQGELLRVKAEAEADRYRIEQQAIANLAIKKAEAEGLLAYKKAEAEGLLLEAKGLEAKERSVGNNIIKLRFVENLKDLKLPQTVISSGTGSDNVLKILNIADFAKQ